MVRLTPSTSQPPQLVSVPRAECLVLPTCTVYVCCPFPPVIHHWYLHLLFVPAYLPPPIILHLRGFIFVQRQGDFVPLLPVSRSPNYFSTPDTSFILEMGFMIKLGFFFFDDERTFVAICSDTSYPFGFTSIIKLTPIDILKLPVTALWN